MTITTAESLAAASANMLTLTPPPTEAQIDEVLDRLASAFNVSPEIRGEARRLLHARFEIRMDKGQTLTSEGHTPWLDSRRGSIEPFYWGRYKQLLIRKGWPPLVVATMDRATDELLDLLGNPIESDPWQRRGLVMGDVQSGKTASYAALIAKAADAGYKMVILLTGTLENVRRQTQERLDEAFIGFDSRDYLTATQVRQKKHIGVGLIDGRRDGVVFTSRDHDFRKNAASALNISLAAVIEPVLVVSKKNKGVLERLAAWLRARNADREGRIDLPLLMIDDEADNASINTRKDPLETTAINKAIRDLLGLFRRASYVGFTATPFANIFIDPTSTDAMLGDDLFPRDFIHVLEPPTNYIGMHKLFPPIDPLEDFDLEAVSMSDPIRPIEDGDDWLPRGHKKDFEPGPLPDSLRLAMRCFLLASAIRDLRSSDGVLGNGGGIHRSMLVNVSQLTDVQNTVADAVHLELEEIRRAVRLHGALPPTQAAKQSPEIRELAETFKTEFSNCGYAWDTVLSVLHEAIAPVRVQPVNRLTGARSLDYTAVETPPGVRVIAVGGNSLSRGLTLEGLSTSYFMRHSRAYDTLLQMGRWFGYRDGYEDLCRIWLTDEAEGWYRHVTNATAELKRDFFRMKRRLATPREFGLRVRRHPDTLLITARNKMASGLDVDASWDISLIGRGIESSRVYSDTRRNRQNVERIDRLLSRLASDVAKVESSPHGGAVIWRDVPATVVADFLDDFLVHPMNFDFQGDSIATFLREAAASGDAVYSRWTIALPTAGKAKLGGAPARVTLDAIPNVEITLGSRIVKQSTIDGSLLISGKSARVGGLSDLRHGFTVDALEEVASEGDALTESDLRREMRSPLLLVYLLTGVEKVDQKKAAYKDGLVLPALGLHFPGVYDQNGAKNLVSYRLNKVAQAELLGDDETEEYDNEPDD